jgi:hypothetical protein
MLVFSNSASWKDNVGNKEVLVHWTPEEASLNYLPSVVVYEYPEYHGLDPAAHLALAHREEDLRYRRPSLRAPQHHLV